jgi:hypothetical protein
MRKLLLLLVLVASTSLLAAGSAGAVMWGHVDEDNEYPWVGLMLAVDEDGESLWRCSGSLLSDDVFLTAGHCVGDAVDPPHSVRIWFDVGPIELDPVYLQNLEDEVDDPCEGATGYPCAGYDAVGTPVPHPEYADFAGFPNTHDVGLVVDLQWSPDAENRPETFGTLAPVGTLDPLATRRGKQDTTFTVVGYGLQSVVPSTSAVRERRVATVTLNNLRSALTDGYNLAHSGAPGKGTGGGATCFGDSGGPVLYQGEVVAVTSFGLNGVCMGPGFAYRTDIEPMYSWITGHVE